MKNKQPKNNAGIVQASANGKLSMLEQVRLLNSAFESQMNLIKVNGQQMALLEGTHYDEAGLNNFFEAAKKELATQGLELTEMGLGRVFR